MNKLKEIAGPVGYKKVISKVDKLMSLGSSNVTKKELAEIKALPQSAQLFEQNKYFIEAPTTLTGIIEMRMFELQLKQKNLAKKVNKSDTKLSLIMSGKQKPDIQFLKTVHKELKVSGDFLLEAI